MNRRGIFKVRKLPKPTDDVKDVFHECISNIRDQAFKDKLDSCKDEIACATLEFETKVVGNQAFTIQEHDNIGEKITNTDMKKIYTDKMVKESQPGRKYYDKYITTPKNGICPLCGQREVATLDHYLPKMKYPSLAVSPSNLIPACRDCNTGKNDKTFSNSSEETIHPYFDDIENEDWLYAKIIENEEVIIIFEVRKPLTWSNLIYERVENHFIEFNLNKLYSTHAAVEFSGVRHRLINTYKRAGSEGLKEHLVECYESYKMVHINSWQTAMYRALCESDWFCYQWVSYQG